MIILSIDSGIEKTGFSLFEKNNKLKNGYKYITSDLIFTSKIEKSENRLKKIYDELFIIFLQYKPDILVLEQLFFFKNLKTAIVVAQAQGIVMLLAAKNKIPIEFLTPLEIKQTITGYGRADKKSVQKMLNLLLGQEVTFKNDDVADAIACGLAYCYLNK